jgi:hypothetical protein
LVRKFSNLPQTELDIRFLETLEFAGRMISAGWFICAKIEAETVPGT